MWTILLKWNFFRLVLWWMKWKRKARNTLEAEASRGTVWHPRHITPQTKECSLVYARPGMPQSEPVATKENSAKVFFLFYYYFFFLEICTTLRKIFSKLEKWKRKWKKIFKNWKKFSVNTALPLRQNKTQFFHSYRAWGEPFLRLALLWSTNTRWLKLW